MVLGIEHMCLENCGTEFSLSKHYYKCYINIYLVLLFIGGARHLH
jgi:hypothetical protein